MAADRIYKKIHHLKVEADVGVAMRGGVRLSARVYRPDTDGQFPVLLAVSPYQHQTDSIPHSTLFLWREAIGPADIYQHPRKLIAVC